MNYRLTEKVKAAGWAAKLGPSDLEEIIGSLASSRNKAVLVGPGDDAGVYLLDGRYALVETVDIITPLVNDPLTFGAVSAVNSLSDVYAMGGKPLTALAVVGFSSCDYETPVIQDIIRGATGVLDSVGVSLMGGHSFEDSELKFGLSVTGLVDPVRILRSQGAEPGDILVLTKPIGIGVMTTALKGGKITDREIEPVVSWMLTLNDKASAAALGAGATAATDVTGFGFLGHAYTMVRGGAVDFLIDHRSVPVLDRVRDCIASGIIPEGAYNNLTFLQDKADFSASVSEDERLLLSDPQTAGGLLIALPDAALPAFASAGIFHSVVGTVQEGTGRIKVR